MSGVVNESGFTIERIRKIDAGEPIISIKFIGDVCVFVLGEESLLVVAPESVERRRMVHEGAILSAAGYGNQLVTGGDDGRIFATGPNGESRLVALDSKRRWIDRVAVGPFNAVAWSAGKQVFVQCDSVESKTLGLPSTVGGLAFLPNQMLLAIAHYNGITLWRFNNEIAPVLLERKGSHLGITISPDGQFVVTTMMEPALHGWRLNDRTEIPMHGYAAPVRSVDWTPNGKWLASSGSQYLVLWPFQQLQNPLSTVPLLLAGYKLPATVVSCHPSREIVAVGYEDGLALLVRIEDEAEILVKNADASSISAMAWNSAGTRLALACKNGTARIIDLK